MVVSHKSPALTGANPRTRDIYLSLVQCLEALPSLRSKGVRLPLPEFMTDGLDPLDKRVKEFSVGLLENPVNHCWSSTLSSCSSSSDDRMSVAGSLFLFRKALPVPPACPSLQRDRITADPLVIGGGYLEHCSNIVRNHFPVGWDRRFEKAVEGTCPNVSSCLEASRGKGGVRSQWAGSRRAFIGAFAHDEVPRVTSDVRYMNAECDGKSRGVTVNSADTLFLAPIHKLMYDQLTKSDWLLRGEAKPCRFQSFRAKRGEIFVSGDYSAATDNMSLEVAEHLLASIFSRCRFIPVSAQLAAFRSLRANVWYDNCSVPFIQTRGQLMGSFLSFPLLCLQNYCAFKFVVNRPVPVKVNGDDIVFRATESEWLKWRDFCPSIGLLVHPTKTMRSQRYFSLNSTFFKALSKGVKLIPVIRPATLAKPVDCPGAIAGGFKSFCRGFKGETLEVVQSTYLRFRSKEVRASGRSLMALGVRAYATAIAKAGLWRRELWFSEVGAHGSNAEQRLPVNPGKIKWVGLPAGWERVPLSKSPSRRRAQREAEIPFWEAVVSSTWDGPVSKNSKLRNHWREVRLTGLESAWSSWRRGAKSFHAGKHWRALFVRYCGGCPRVSDPFRLRVGEKLRRWLFCGSPRRPTVWAPVARERVCPRFVPATHQ